MARRNYSQELHQAQQEGCTIVCSVAPYEGHRVEYAPRRIRDPKPWAILSHTGGYRCSGRDCHAIRPAE